MIKPPDIAAEVWEFLTAAASGDIASLRDLLARDAGLHRAEYWYTPPLHFAVREGHLEAVRLLLAAVRRSPPRAGAPPRRAPGRGRR